MANSANSPLKGWEYPAGSDIRIREVINRSGGKDFGVSYRVSIPTKLAGRRILKQFRDVDAAETWAKDQYKGLRKTGHAHFEKLSPRKRADVQKALDDLEGSGLTLSEAVRIAKVHHKVAEQNQTIAKAVEIMLEEKAKENLRPRSISNLKNTLKPFVAKFGAKRVQTVTKRELQVYLDNFKGNSKRSTEGLSPRSKQNHAGSLKTLFNFAIANKWRAAGDNPAEGLVIPKIDWKPPAILTIAEAEKLIQTASRHEGGSLLGYVALGLFAGIRSNELGLLKWSHIDLEEGIVTIGADIAKKRRLRVIELMPNAIAWLKRCPDRKGDLVKNFTPSRASELYKEAGFANWRQEKSNAMRHSFGTYHYALHQSAALTSAALGHREGDQVLFDSYRSLARKRDGEAYFAIFP